MVATTSCWAGEPTKHSQFYSKRRHLHSFTEPSGLAGGASVASSHPSAPGPFAQDAPRNDKSEMKQVIQLEKDDDLASIRTQLQGAELSQVVLVIPRDYNLLNNDPALQLLRRAAQDAGIEIALVTRDPDLAERGNAFGVSSFGSVGQARRAQWRMRRLERPSFGDQAALAVGNPENLFRKNSPTALTFDKLREWRLPIALIIVVIFFFFVAAILVVPAANVRIVPASIPLSLTSDIIIDPTIAQVNSETRSVPARRISHEITGNAQLRTTTTKSLPDARSSGTVIFTNLRDEETMIPQGTIVKTSAGVTIRFTTATTATLPAGANSRVETAIQAVEAGLGSNVKELAINVIEGSLNLEARVINLKPTASGTVKPVRVVTAADKANLEAQLTQQLKKQAADELKKEIKGDEFIPADSVVLDDGDKIFDHTVDEPADILNLKLNTDAYGLAVDPEDLESLVRALLQKQIQTGYLMLPGGAKVDALTNGKYQGVALKASMRATGYMTPQLDAGKVSRALQGKSVDEAASYLSNQVRLAQPPSINVTPPGWNRLPWFTFRIAVFIEPQTVTQK